MTGPAIRLTAGSAGEQANGSSSNPVFLADGRTVVFSSAASNLVSGDTNGKVDVFAKDLVTGQVTKLTSGSDGAPLAVNITSFTISANGSTLAYVAAGAVSGTGDLYTKDLASGQVAKITTSAVSSSTTAGTTIHPSLSADGKILVFSSSDSSLVADDTNNFIDVFAKNLNTGDIIRVSTSSSGAQAVVAGAAPQTGTSSSLLYSGASTNPFVSDNGKLVAFTSAANDISSRDVDNRPDIFVKNLSTGELTVVPNVSGGDRGSSSNYVVDFSGDGKNVLAINTAPYVHGNGASSDYSLESVDLAAAASTAITLTNYLTGGGIYGGVYSHDAGKVAYGKADFTVPTKSSYFIEDVQSGISSKIAATDTFHSVSQVEFSPDGTRISYIEVLPGQNEISDVYVKDLTDPVFGQRVYDASSAGGKIYALYDGLLGRAPDPVGLEAYTAAVNAGASLRDLAQGMLQSPEGQARAGAVGNAEFVSQLYRAALHREPDAAGLENWVRFLDQGGSRTDVGLGFALSTEHLNTIQGTLSQGVWVADAAASQAARLYYGVLHRSPDAAGLADWTRALKEGASVVDVAQVFLTSKEGEALNTLGNSAFVDSLYVNALGRHAEAAGLAGWTNYLAQGGSRSQVAATISEGPEAQAHLVGVIEKGWFLA